MGNKFIFKRYHVRVRQIIRDSKTIEYTYNPLGQLTEIKDWLVKVGKTYSDQTSIQRLVKNIQLECKIQQIKMVMHYSSGSILG